MRLREYKQVGATRGATKKITKEMVAFIGKNKEEKPSILQAFLKRDFGVDISKSTIYQIAHNTYYWWREV